ncbi:MAG: hypothetical protein EBZ69_04660 [Alphaproteobacteria bacterium]|nr:hypothetical protein [Alphaproteobacteria bacterium]NDG05402.1 hypothetical protein [Alphaproteobacteria bacterium]
MLPIILGVRRRSDALFLRPDIKPPPAEKILARDNFTCQACGFQAKKFLRVMPHPTADNYKTLDAWVTGCSFCDQCYALESLSAQGSGHLIWLPEIPQATLNHLARAMFVAREAGGTLAELATRAYDLLMSRRA